MISTALVALSFLLSLVMGWSLVDPFFRPVSADDTSLRDERERLFRALEDLEREHREGRLPTEDFGDLKERLVSDLAEVMKKIEG